MAFISNQIKIKNDWGGVKGNEYPQIMKSICLGTGSNQESKWNVVLYYGVGCMFNASIVQSFSHMPSEYCTEV